MFTGIIQSLGKIVNIQRSAQENTNDDIKLTFSLGKIDINKVSLGDSIAVNGVCLTAVNIDKSNNTVEVDVSKETLEVTLIGNYKVGDKLNLELALTANAFLGGHLVSGHVDGIASLHDMYPDGESTRLVFSLSQQDENLELARYIAQKGSVCIDGVSLTTNFIEDDADKKISYFGINIVPHTQSETIIGEYTIAQKVHVEIDVIARYLKRQFEFAKTYQQ